MSEQKQPGVDKAPSDDVVKFIKETADAISRCDPELAHTMTAQLNLFAIEKGLIGKRSSLSSKEMFRRIQYLNPDTQTIEWVELPADYTGDVYYGRFAGFKLGRDDEGVIRLMYQLDEAEDDPMIDTSLSAESYAPVKGATLSLVDSVQSQDQYEDTDDVFENSEWYRFIDTLSEPDNALYQQQFQELIRLFDQTETWNAQAIAMFGRLAMEMLRALASDHSPSIEDALIGVAQTLIGKGQYTIRGDAVIYDKGMMTVYKANGVFEVDDIDMIVEYQIQDEAVQERDTWQLVLKDATGRAVPLAYLEHFQPVDVTQTTRRVSLASRYCDQDWRDDYLDTMGI